MPQASPPANPPCSRPASASAMLDPVSPHHDIAAKRGVTSAGVRRPGEMPPMAPLARARGAMMQAVMAPGAGRLG